MEPIGTKGYGVITPGMSVYGTNIAASTKVAGLIYGNAVGANPSTITGVTLDTVTSGVVAAGASISFTPTITMTGFRQATV